MIHCQLFGHKQLTDQKRETPNTIRIIERAVESIHNNQHLHYKMMQYKEITIRIVYFITLHQFISGMQKCYHEFIQNNDLL